MTIKEISELIVDGFEKLVISPGRGISKYDACKGCDELLLAWDGLKHYMDKSKISDIWELEKKELREFRRYNIHPSFIFQLLADELHNAGIKDKSYFEKRIQYCTDFSTYIGDESVTKENMRIAIADSYFWLGNEAECDKLYSEWLEADPQWGQGYVGWANNYEHGWQGRKDLGKAAGIYERALGVADVRDRYDVVSQALRFYDEIGDKEKHASLREELSRLEPDALGHYPDQSQKLASAKKPGRNEPCPCGSGKKYKKCCGA